MHTKNKIINNYIHIITLLFVIYNILFRYLIITGNLYHMLMITLIISNIVFIINNKEKVKYKGLAIIIYWLIWIISKDFYGIIFVISCLMTLISTDFVKSTFVKIIVIIITLFISIAAIVFLYLYIIIFALRGVVDDQIYEDTHYYCKNNYEVYSYSAGAMESIHYSIGKHYVILDFNDIIYISYNERKDVSQKEYNKYLNTHKCKLVGDVNGFK